MNITGLLVVHSHCYWITVLTVSLVGKQKYFSLKQQISSSMVKPEKKEFYRVLQLFSCLVEIVCESFPSSFRPNQSSSSSSRKACRGSSGGSGQRKGGVLFPIGSFLVCSRRLFVCETLPAVCECITLHSENPTALWD